MTSSDNTVAAIIKVNGITLELDNNASSVFMKNLIEALKYA